MFNEKSTRGLTTEHLQVLFPYARLKGDLRLLSLEDTELEWYLRAALDQLTSRKHMIIASGACDASFTSKQIRVCGDQEFFPTAFFVGSGVYLDGSDEVALEAKNGQFIADNKLVDLLNEEHRVTFRLTGGFDSAIADAEPSLYLLVQRVIALLYEYQAGGADVAIGDYLNESFISSLLNSFNANALYTSA